MKTYEKTRNVYSEENSGCIITIFKCLKGSHMEDEIIWPQKVEPGLWTNALRK